LLVRLLTQAGHDVLTALDVNLGAKSDAVQLTRAVQDDRVIVTHNHDDFRELHLLVKECRGEHPGILVVRKDNDPSRDMSSRGIANAIGKLERSGVPFRNEFSILNQWR
jgi:hypothetical protein